MSSRNRRRHARQKRSRQRMKTVCPFCRRICACGKPALAVPGKCYHCPMASCLLPEHPPRCKSCWKKISFVMLCNDCYCNYPIGCQCPGESGYRTICQECYDSYPLQSLPNAQVISEPVLPEKVAWYEKEVEKWVRHNLELGRKREDLLNFLIPVDYHHMGTYEWYDRTEIQHQAVIKAFARQDEFRLNIRAIIMSIVMLPKPLAQLIAKLTIP